MTRKGHCAPHVSPATTGEKGGHGAQEELLPRVPLYVPDGQGLQEDVLWSRNMPAWQLQRLLSPTGHMPGGQGRQRDSASPTPLLKVEGGQGTQEPR
jgi:hypothetical protein